MATETEKNNLTGHALLDAINAPADLRELPVAQLPALAGEIRDELLRVVSARGGHLASNLGAVELTIALLYVLDLDNDCIVWDTGHQGYTYKLLTGRREFFQTLRQDDGCCGFLHPDESAYDTFGAGHAGTAISAALGMAAARDRAGRSGHVVAVVGDGALGTGVALEGLNSIIETTPNFILVLNDNRMSIAPNVGALSRYLNSMIAGEPYNSCKRVLRNMVCRIPRIGQRLRRMIQKIEEATKSVLVPGVLFEELGLRYIGPLDGHDLQQLIDTLTSVRRLRQPLVVHVLTEKGHGYKPAARAPETFHGLGGFDLDSGAPVRPRGTAIEVPTFASNLGQSLCRLLDEDDRIVAVTAGMCHGTGLAPVREQHPDRFFDVGIAEEHAVVFAAGMAAAGLRPVVAIYATFMQRAMDYVFHDVCLQNLPVVFCLDRAGAVSDGPTHHGILDLAFWRALPNLAVLQPADAWEQTEMLRFLLDRNAPAVMRYPKGSASPLRASERAPLTWGKAEPLRPGADLAIWALGREAALALDLADDLTRHGLNATVVNPRFVLPLDRALLTTQVAAGMPIVSIENHSVEGGFASVVKEALAGVPGSRLLCFGWPRKIVPWGTESGIRARFGLDREHILADILAFIGKTNSPCPNSEPK